MSIEGIDELIEFVTPKLHSWDQVEAARVAFVNQKLNVQDLESFHERPHRVKRQLSHLTLASFIDYAKAWELQTSKLYADRKALNVLLIVDDSTRDDGPTWGDHRSNYTCPLSKQWQAWIGSNKKRMAQLEMLEFLEDNLADIHRPDGSEILSMVTKFRETRNHVFSSEVSVQSGEFVFEATDTRQSARSSTKLPEELILGLPVFENGKAYEVKARLRYRIQEGALSLWYELAHPDRMVDDAFTNVVVEVKEKLEGWALYEAKV